MASIFLRHAQRASTRQWRTTGITLRQVHASPVALKKNAKVDIENLFDDEGDSLFDEKSVSSSSQPSSSSSVALKASAVTPEDIRPVQRRKCLSSEERHKRFQVLCDFIIPRLGRHPKVPHPPIRHTALMQLIGLANTREHLEMLVELFPQWKERGLPIREIPAAFFIQRCEQLNSADLALKVFSDFPRYSAPLSLLGARQLLHAAHKEGKVEDVMLASSLFGVHKLPPVSEDLPSCAMVAAALLDHAKLYREDRGKEALAVADALLANLRTLTTAKKTEKLEVSRHPRTRAKDKPSVWAMWAMKTIDVRLWERNGKRREDWLRDWRARSGHIRLEQGNGQAEGRLRDVRAGEVF